MKHVQLVDLQLLSYRLIAVDLTLCHPVIIYICVCVIFSHIVFDVFTKLKFVFVFMLMMWVFSSYVFIT